MSIKPTPYIGRFAPSPSGPLHLGSLVTALASYVDARHAKGQWLLRIEDLDPPREAPGAQTAILNTLEGFGFEWDGPVVRQSTRQDAYQYWVEHWRTEGLAYACLCSRKDQAEQASSIYPGTCSARAYPASDAAIRLRVPALLYKFTDALQGSYRQLLHSAVGDFVIRRRDQLIAYQLAVVVDDAWQGVTHIVRGADLLDSTPRQLYLQELMRAPTPEYAHVPLVLDRQGKKLSKSSSSTALVVSDASTQLYWALQRLNQSPPAELIGAAPKLLLEWAVLAWQRSKASTPPAHTELLFAVKSP